FFCAGHQTTCRVIWPISALQQILGEMTERPGVGYDACWPPPLEFPVAIFKYLRREPEAVEGLDVGDEAIDAIAQAVGRCRIETRPLETPEPRANGQPQPSHKRFSAALAPSSLFRAHPDLGRRSAGSSCRVTAQMTWLDGAGYKPPASPMRILAP